MSDDLGIAKQWLGKAMNDLLNADNNLKSEMIPYDTVCFHCQQAAEKLLKAYLIGNGQTYPFTHDLFMLSEKILSLNTEINHLKDSLAILMPYAVEVRYPDDWFMPSDEDAREARAAAENVLSWFKDALPNIFNSN